MYELEILRLLFLFSSNDSAVQQMLDDTRSRLKTTCFGNDNDGVGECFDTALVVLRFLGTVAPDERRWIQERIDNYHNHVNEKKRPWFARWYFWLCLSELPFEMAKPEIDQYKEEILHILCKKSFVMNSEHDKIIHPILFCMLRNIICKYPEYSYIKARAPYINPKDGRLYFDLK